MKLVSNPWLAASYLYVIFFNIETQSYKIIRFSTIFTIKNKKIALNSAIFLQFYRSSIKSAATSHF